MILVTGGTGLVGSHLLFDLVQQGKKVRAIMRKGSDLKAVERTFAYYSPQAAELFSKIEWVVGDVLDIHSLMEAMDSVTHVYHCAAMISFVPSDEQLMLRINVEGTANVVNSCIEKKIAKLCHVSSIAALGKLEHGIVIDEESYWKSAPGNSNYSISKYGAEREVWRGMEEGLNAVIVNPSIIIGPGTGQRGSQRIFHTIYNGLSFYAMGENGWVDVRDVTRSMVRLMDSEIKSERFIISAENASFKKVFELTAGNFGKKKPSFKAGRWISAFAWRADRLRCILLGRTPVLTKETANSAVEISQYSNQKIKKALQFEFIDLEKSLKENCLLFLKDKNSQR